VPAAREPYAIEPGRRHHRSRDTDKSTWQDIIVNEVILDLTELAEH